MYPFLPLQVDISIDESMTVNS